MSAVIAEERRHAERIKPPKPCWRISMVLQTDRFAKRIFGSFAGTAAFLGVFTLCLGVIVWSIYFRLPTIDESYSLVNEQARLQLRLEDLRTIWSEEELNRIEANISREQEKIFEDFPAFASWLAGKSDTAQQLGLEMSYRLNQQKSTRLDGIISVALNISLKNRGDTADKTYIRFLEFTRSLIEENLRLEVAGNVLKSDGKGLTGMSLDMFVWLKDANAIGGVPEADDTEEAEDVDIPNFE